MMTIRQEGKRYIACLPDGSERVLRGVKHGVSQKFNLPTLYARMAYQGCVTCVSGIQTPDGWRLYYGDQVL